MKIDPVEVARINEYIKEHKLKVTHLRYFDFYGDIKNRGGMTVVWKNNKPGRLFPVSTAVCRDDEIFSRTIGRVVAVQNFENGYTVNLMSGRNKSCFQTLSQLFQLTYRQGRLK